MHWISLLLLGLTAGLFLYIMVLETFLTDSQLTARTFNMSTDELRKPALNTAMKNGSSDIWSDAAIVQRI